MISILSASFVATSRRALMAAAVLAAMVVVGPMPIRAADHSEQQQLVDKAKMTLDAFAADPGLRNVVRELKGEVKALFIVPQFMRGAFVPEMV